MTIIITLFSVVTISTTRAHQLPQTLQVQEDPDPVCVCSLWVALVLSRWRDEGRHRVFIDFCSQRVYLAGDYCLMWALSRSPCHLKSSLPHCSLWSSSPRRQQDSTDNHDDKDKYKDSSSAAQQTGTSFLLTRLPVCVCDRCIFTPVDQHLKWHLSKSKQLRKHYI